MKKGAIIMIVVILLILMLLPVQVQMRDGGTVVYKAVLYEVQDFHRLTEVEGEFATGLVVTVLGIEVYNSVPAQ